MERCRIFRRGRQTVALCRLRTGRSECVARHGPRALCREAMARRRLFARRGGSTEPH
jgi:hypothetical protein